MKLRGKDKKTQAPRETLREKWKRELLKHRVDAKGMEPIRVRVQTVRNNTRGRHQHL